MTILLFGATGLVGSGVLRACLTAPAVTEVRAVVRRTTGVRHPKLREIVHDDFLDYSTVATEFAGVDACFFCLGISVSQVPLEPDYRRIHYDFPMAAAALLRERSPSAVFHYISGGGTRLDSRWMWARVKGEAERDLIDQFGAVCWRPAMVGGTPGANPPLYLTLLRPIGVLLKPFKRAYIESEDIGRAMMTATMQGMRGRIVENPEMRDLAVAGA
jgi:uncharacterized protein YbjT (DUF2867 family)